MLSNVSDDIRDKITRPLNHDAITSLTSSFEHIIHTGLFLGLSLILFNLLKHRMKNNTGVYLTAIAVSLGLSISNELFQDLFVKGRAFEFIDVVYGGLGILLGFVLFVLKTTIKEYKQAKEKQ